MIAQEIGKPSEYETWTNQQRYQRIRARMAVEVKLISHNGGPHRWVQAKVVDVNKGGCFCKVTEGQHLERFWHWTELRPSTQVQPKPAIATLGEAVGRELQAVVTKPAPETPVLAASSAHPSSPPPQTPLVLVRRPNLDRPFLDTTVQQRVATMGPDDPKHPRNMFAINKALPVRVSKSEKALGGAIGNMIKDARFAKNITQWGLADLCSKAAKKGGKGAVYNSRLSQVELGKSLPTDDELVALSEVLGLNLDRLIEAREETRAEHAEIVNEKREAEQRERQEKREAEERERRAFREYQEEQKRKAEADATRGERAQAEAREAERRSEIAQRVNMPPPAARTYELPPREPEPPRRNAVYASEPEPPYQELVRLERRPAPAPAPIETASMELPDLMTALESIVPMPREAEARKRWIACAMELWKLSGGAT